MGDAKRRQLGEVIKRVTDNAANEGKIIEMGWQAFRAIAIWSDAPQIQIDEMRLAFFAGAQHLHASIMTFLDAGEEITDRDLLRMDRIAQELDAFIAEFKLRHIPTEGQS